MMNYTIYFYVFSQIISLIFLYLGVKNNNSKTKNIFIFCSAMILISIIGFRSISTGVDTNVYAKALYRYVNNMTTISDKNWLSSGYFLIFFFIKNIFGYNYVALNLIIGILSIVLLYKSILGNSKNPVLSLFIFFSTCLFLQCINQSRQMLAIIIVLYSFKYIKESNFKKYFFTVLIASLIHSSAFVVLPFYFLKNVKINFKIILFYVLIALFAMFCEDFINKLLLLTPYGNVYITNNYMVESQKSSYINLIVRFLLLLFAFFFKKSSLSDKTTNNNYLYHMAIWTFLTQIITLNFYIFGRITTYFFAFYIIFLPNLLHNIQNNYNKKFYTLLVCVLFILYFLVYYSFVSARSGYNVYEFFWN